MSSRLLSLLVMVIILGCSPKSRAQPHVYPDPIDRGTSETSEFLYGSAERTRLYVGEDGEVYVGVWVDIPERPRHRRGYVDRPAMSVSLVIDTSGSMAGNKIENARTAAAALIRSLRDGDMVSIVGFDDHAEVHAVPTVISRQTRSRLLQKIDRLRPGGSTNMAAGIALAETLMSETPESRPLRRLILISDGRANVGSSSAYALGNLAARITEYGAQATVIGVGLDYSEQTLSAIAVQTSGRMYHLSEPAQLSEILASEIHSLGETYCLGARLMIEPLESISDVEPVTLGALRTGEAIQYALGNLSLGTSREILVRANVGNRRRGENSLVRATLTYQTPEGETRSESRIIEYEGTVDRHTSAASAAPRVNAMLATYRASQAQLQAAQRLSAGDDEGAQRAFSEAQRNLREAVRTYDSVPSAAPVAVQSQLRAAEERNNRASRSAGSGSAPAARSAGLEATDSAMELQGF